MEKKSTGISKWGLVALVVSSSIGSGVFGITSDLASSAAPGPAILSWIIVGIGILALVLSLNHLGEKRPDLDGGIFGYAEASFGKLGGFISGWGYWLSAWLGNVAFATMLMSAMGEFFPIFKGGQNVPSILFASIFIWGLTLLVNNGVEGASVINTIVTICKLVPLFLFLIFVFIAFKVNIFTADFWGNVSDNLVNGTGQQGTIWLQIKGCLMVMMWVFVRDRRRKCFSQPREETFRSPASIDHWSALFIVYLYPCFDLAIRRLISRRVSNYFTTCYGKYFKRNRGKLGSSADQYRLDYFDHWFLVVLDDAPSRNNDVDGSRRSVAERLGKNE